ncbi:lipopolysaccharide biosynthesis protein [Dyella caseinilytica]|uniref:Lipopolysaccharide biosynthesis protein n=2 Tax=Dyella caseinilytica TaxID=1849581 RepID=A0ABX7GZY2_9GAMM|nr:lipopolysaccharide biosynthesis protein [Dyella caseinilytica]QRN56029.1 lipopolysaccharide biosynthesis protein [Dyella caseinilytica]GFZ87546.1 polysaccharide biosynthesis protein [Dyella caseinilytica]
MAFAFGPIATAGLGLLTVPAIAWIFPPADVGRLNMVQISVSFGVLLFNLGLDRAYIREYHEWNDRGALLKACFVPGFALLLLVMVLTFPYDRRISIWLFGQGHVAYYWILVACVMASFVSRFLSLILRMQDRGLAFSMSQVLPKIILLLILGVLALPVFSKSFMALEIAYLVSLLSVLAIYMWNTRRDWSPALTTAISQAQIRGLLSYGVPLIFAGVAYWGLDATSSVALRSLSTLSELAVYSVSVSFAGVGVVFQTIFTVLWAPLVYKWVAHGVDMRRVDHIAQQALAVVCAIWILSGVFSWVTDFVLPARYLQVKYFMLCCIGQPLLYTLSEVTCVGIGITRKSMLSLWSTLAALIVNVSISVWLVPSYGAAGAVVANAVAFLAFFIARTEASAYVWRPFPRARLYVCVVAAVALSIATLVLGPVAPVHFSFVWLAMLPIVGWHFRAEWLGMYRSLHSAVRLDDSPLLAGRGPDGRS